MTKVSIQEHSEQEKYFIKRLIQLRLEKGVSARDMSLSIGQSESYINRIESGKMFPSMPVFFYICDYFDITPAEFFLSEKYPSANLIHAMKKLQKMDPKKCSHILSIIDDMQ